MWIVRLRFLWETQQLLEWHTPPKVKVTNLSQFRKTKLLLNELTRICFTILINKLQYIVSPLKSRHIVLQTWPEMTHDWLNNWIWHARRIKPGQYHADHIIGCHVWSAVFHSWTIYVRFLSHCLILDDDCIPWTADQIIPIVHIIK